MKAHRLFWLVPALALFVACGRSNLRDGVLDGVECRRDADCNVADDKCAIVACQQGSCVMVGAKTCDDGDACTADSCDPATGECRNEPLTPDLDGDGHRAPLPGFRPGEPGACGDDCDDANPNAYPGNVEVCDGVDNDCNGIVDDGTTYVLSSEEPILVSGTQSPATPGGIAFGNGGYVAAFTESDADLENAYVTRIGESVGESSNLADIPFRARAGNVVSAGDRLGVVYARRSPNVRNEHTAHEIRFSTLTLEGQRLGEDIRVHRGVRAPTRPPAIAFTGSEFVVVWAHSLEWSAAFDFHVYAQRLDRDGNLIGPNVPISILPGDDPLRFTDKNIDNEAPQVAIGRESIGIVWTRTHITQSRILFRTYDFELRPLMEEPVILTPPGTVGAFPTIAYNEATETYLVAYHDPIGTPRAIYGATVAEDGTVITPARPITDSPRHSRYPALVPLGDRTLVVFSDTKDQNQGYELYMKTLDHDLAPLGPELRLTDAPGDSILPFTSFGPNGDIGVLFRDNRDGQQQVYFSRLVCMAAGSP